MPYSVDYRKIDMPHALRDKLIVLERGDEIRVECGTLTEASRIRNKVYGFFRAWDYEIDHRDEKDSTPDDRYEKFGSSVSVKMKGSIVTVVRHAITCEILE